MRKNQGSGFRVQGLGFWVLGVPFRRIGIFSGLLRAMPA